MQYYLTQNSHLFVETLRIKAFLFRSEIFIFHVVHYLRILVKRIPSRLLWDHLLYIPADSHAFYPFLIFYITYFSSFCPQPSSGDACPVLRPVQASTCPTGTTHTTDNRISRASSLCFCGQSPTPRPATVLSACSQTT